MTVDIASLNALYRFTASGHMSVVKARSEEVFKFCELYRTFRLVSRANPDDLLLGDAVRFANRLRYRILTTPLPLNHPAVLGYSAAADALKRLSIASSSYNELKIPAERFASITRTIQSCVENPLWKSVEEEFRSDSGANIGFVIGQLSLVAAVREMLKRDQTRDARVITDTDLRGLEVFDRLYIFGPARWYQVFVFSAPRALDVRIVRYAHLKDQVTEGQVFVKLLKPSSRKALNSDSASVVVDTSIVDVDDPAPMEDTSWILRMAVGVGEDVSSQHDAVDRLDVMALVLEQEMAVLVSASDGASELVIDLREDGEALLRRVPTSNLEPGMAILLRTEGGGDFVVSAADRIMGGAAKELRQRQRWWKGRLRALVEEFGWERTIGQLRRAGSKIASQQNLRNWMSPRSIRTHRKRDFEAIFAVIGSGGSTDEYWNKMAKIDTAHRLAGFVIRKQLLRQMRNADLSPLQAYGRQDFALPGDVGGGSLAAIRITRIVPGTVESSASSVHRLFRLDD